MNLTGRRIALTRPGDLDLQTRDDLLAAGALPSLYPLLRIEARVEPLSGEEASALRRSQGLIFISPTAVKYSLPLLRALGLPDAQQWLGAMGQGTVAALQQGGLKATLAPEGIGDAMALLELPPLSRVRDQQLAVLQASGQPSQVVEPLQGRGAKVQVIPVYRRTVDDTAIDLLLHDLPQLDAIVLTTSEAARRLLLRAGESARLRLQCTPILAIHPKIAALLATAGMRQVHTIPALQQLHSVLETLFG